MNRHIFLAFLLLAVLPSARSQSESLDWPGWRGPDANGISRETEVKPSALAGQPKILWKASLGAGYSSIAVKGTYLYSLGNKNATDTVLCLSAETGKTVWSYSYPCALGSYPGPKATPTIDGGSIYTLSRVGQLFSLDAKTGKMLWAKTLQGDFGVWSPDYDFAGSPVVVGDRIILNAGRAGLALDKTSGARIWDSGTGPGGYATPVVADIAGKRLAVIFGQRAVYGVDVRSGAVLWSFDWQTGSNVNAADPVVLDGKVFVASAYGKGSGLFDVTKPTPVPVWTNNAFETHFSSFVAIGGYLYGISGDARVPGMGSLRCVEVRTGKTAWSEPLGFGSLIAAGNRLVVLTSIGTIIVADATPVKYRELARCSLPRNQYWTPPALAQGRLYVRNWTGDLFAIDVH